MVPRDARSLPLVLGKDLRLSLVGRLQTMACYKIIFICKSYINLMVACKAVCDASGPL